MSLPLFLQIHSVGPDGIPKWSTPSVIQHFRPVPPPTNITVTVINDPVLDTENKVVEVIALVQWELPVLDGGDSEVTEEPTVPQVSSVVVSTMLPVAPTSTPVPPVQTGGGDPGNDVRRRRRQQSDEGGESQSGSGMGSGDGDDVVVPIQIGELTNIFIYMGTTPLDRFAPRPEENVQQLKVFVHVNTTCTYTHVSVHMCLIASTVQSNILQYIGFVLPTMLYSCHIWHMVLVNHDESVKRGMIFW